MEDEREDGRQNMHCMEDELAETRKKSAETVLEKRCDDFYQIYEMKDKVYAKFEKAEETRCVSSQQAEYILSEEKDKVSEVRQLPYKNIDEKMSYLEENSAEARRFTFRRMADMEEK